MSGKGQLFERKVCVQLSLWVSGGKQRDCFWRSAMSGGRATVAFKRGVRLDRQAGDICAISPEGHVLTDRYFLECKHRRNINFQQFVLTGKGQLARWWEKTVREAKRHDREPVLIIRGNFMPVLVITKRNNVRFNPAPVVLAQRTAIGMFEQTLKKPWGKPILEITAGTIVSQVRGR